LAQVEAIASPPAAASVVGFRLGYRPSLDGLRGVAVLVVMAHHAYVPFFHGGGVGVDIFFVLSGFLITSLLLEEWQRRQSVSLRGFYLRRALRLLPALFVLLLALQTFTLLRMHGEAFWEMEKAIGAVLGYFGNWVAALNLYDMRVLAHTWSLSIEEQFYFLWPVALLLMLRNRWSPKQILSGLFLTAGVIAVTRAGLAGTLSVARIYNGSDFRFDELLTGCALAVALHAGMIRQPVLSVVPYLVLPAIAVIFRLIAFPTSFVRLAAIGWPAIEASVAAIVLYLVTGSQTALHKILETRWLVWVGRISYGLYLWHVPVLGKAGGFGLPGPLKVAAGFALTFAAAGLSYYLIERRFLRRKARLQPAFAPSQAG